jgi:hypothetical protein
MLFTNTWKLKNILADLRYVVLLPVWTKGFEYHKKPKAGFIIITGMREEAPA